MSIYINLNDEETALLEEVAKEERRTLQQQAAWMVVSGIRSRESLRKMAEQMDRHSPFMQARAIEVMPGAINGEETD